MKEIIEKAKEWALKENKDYGTPLLEHLYLSNKKGQELAEKLNANKDIVLIGTWLMDIKLGECLKEGKPSEHITKSAEATKEFLKQFDINQKIKDAIVNCVEGHHGTVSFICKEAEICANADCYRFLHPRGLFAYFTLLGSRNGNLNKTIEFAENKVEEKHSILSLDICKEELEPYYKMFKTLIDKARI